MSDPNEATEYVNEVLPTDAETTEEKHEEQYTTQENDNSNEGDYGAVSNVQPPEEANVAQQHQEKQNEVVEQHEEPKYHHEEKHEEKPEEPKQQQEEPKYHHEEKHEEPNYKETKHEEPKHQRRRSSYSETVVPERKQEKSAAEFQRDIDALNRKVSELNSKLILREDQNKILANDLNRKSQELEIAGNKAAEETKKALDLDSQLILLRRKLKKSGEDGEEKPEGHSKPSPDFKYDTSLTPATTTEATSSTPTTASLASRNAELHENLRHVTRDLERAEADRKEIDAKCKELEKTIQTHEQKTAEKDLRLQELDSTVKQLQNQVENEKKQREQMEERARKATQEAGEKSELAAQAESRNSEIESLTKKLADATSQVENEKNANKALQSKLEKSSAEIVELKAIIEHSKERSQNRHEQALSLLRSELKQEQEKSAHLSKELERSKAAVKELHEQQQSGKSDEIAAGKSAKVLERKLKNSDKVIEELRAEVLLQKTNISRLEQIIKDNKTKHSELFLAKCDLESQCKHFQHELQLTKGKLELALTPTVYSKVAPPEAEETN